MTLRKAECVCRSHSESPESVLSGMQWKSEPQHSYRWFLHKCTFCCMLRLLFLQHCSLRYRMEARGPGNPPTPHPGGSNPCAKGAVGRCSPAVLISVSWGKKGGSRGGGPCPCGARSKELVQLPLNKRPAARTTKVVSLGLTPALQ